MRKNWFFLILLSVLIFNLNPLAQAGEAPLVGRKAAARYFENDKDVVRRGPSGEKSSAGGNQLLMLGMGSYVGSKAYQWNGLGSEDNVGRASYGFTYLADEWHGMDLNFRADFNEYRVNGDFAKKLSFLPLVTIPRAEARFPLYFGIGLGLGVFFQQVPEESTLAFDYQLVAGARFMDLIDNFGFFFEFAMKHHMHLLSDGQLNGNALTAGGVFSF